MPDKPQPDESERAKHVASVDFEAVVRESKLYGDKGDIPFHMPNGEEFVFPGPLKWPDEFCTWQAQAQAGIIARDPVVAAKLLIGEEEYERFRKAGGNALAFMAFFEDQYGDVGESSA